MVRGYVVEFRKIGPPGADDREEPHFTAKRGHAARPRRRAELHRQPARLRRPSRASRIPTPRRCSSRRTGSSSRTSPRDSTVARGRLPRALRVRPTQLELRERALHGRHGHASTVSPHFAMPKIARAAASRQPGRAAVPLPQTLEDVRSMFLGYHYSLAKLPDHPMRAHRRCRASGHFVTRAERVHDRPRALPAPVLREPLAPREEGPRRRALGAEAAHRLLARPQHSRASTATPSRRASSSGTRRSSASASRTRSTSRCSPRTRTFDTADLRHASVRWYLDTSDGALAIGPSRIDPRTGEILDADIVVSQGWTRLPRALAGEQFPRPDAQAVPGPRPRPLRVRPARPSRKPPSRSGCSKRAARSIPTSPEAEAIVKATLKDVDHPRGRPHAGAAPQLPRLHHLHRRSSSPTRNSRARTAWAAR